MNKKEDQQTSHSEKIQPPQKDEAISPEAHPHINLNQPENNMVNKEDNHNSQNTSKPKGKIWLIIGIVVVIFAVAALGFVVFLLPTINKKAEPQSTLEKSLKSLENNYTNNIIAFNFPSTTAGWTMESSTDPNLKAYKNNASTCKIIFQSSDKVKDLISSGATLSSEIDNYYTNVGNALKNNNLKFGSLGTHPINTSTGNPVDFVTKQATYTGNDGVMYKIEVAGQWMGNYEFFVISACSDSDWNQSNATLNSFLNKINLKITNK